MRVRVHACILKRVDVGLELTLLPRHGQELVCGQYGRLRVILALLQCIVQLCRHAVRLRQSLLSDTVLLLWLLRTRLAGILQSDSMIIYRHWQGSVVISSRGRGRVVSTMPADATRPVQQRILVQFVLLRPSAIFVLFPNDDRLVVRSGNDLGPLTTASARWNLCSRGQHMLGSARPGVTSGTAGGRCRQHASINGIKEAFVGFARLIKQLFIGDGLEVAEACLNGAHEITVTRQTRYFGCTLSIKNAHGVVRRSGDDATTVILHASDAFSVAKVLLDAFAGLDVPCSDCAIARGRDNGVFVNHHCIYCSAVACQGGKKSMFFDEVPIPRTVELIYNISRHHRRVPGNLVSVPDLDRLVLGAGNNVAVVEAEIQYRLCVSLVHPLKQLASGEAPDHDPAVAAPTHNDVVFRRRIELQAKHAGIVTCQNGWGVRPESTSRQVPDAYCLVARA